jgi:polyphosphate kinase
VSKSAPRRKTERSPERFFNRELSWLAFNARVLEEASDASNPLLERVKFAAITASNLDEFFMVRVAGLKNAIREGDAEPDAAGMSPAQQMKAVATRAHEMVEQLYAVVNDQLLPALERAGIRVARVLDLGADQRAALGVYFREQVLPALTPLAIDESRPFPLLASLSLNVVLRLAPVDEGGEARLAVVQVPMRLPRLVRVPGDAVTFVLLSDVIRAEFDTLFPGQRVIESAVVRLARDSELELDDEGGLPYLQAIEEELRQRRRNDVVRVEVEAGVSQDLLDKVATEADVGPDDIYRIPGIVDVRVLMGLADLTDFDELRDKPLKPVPVFGDRETRSLFDRLDERDVFLHHPYESFDSVLELVDEAADDPDVLAIKATLYRTSGDSPIIAALTRAADLGKQVTVIVELMARFDEQRNIAWARKLEESGAHVIYGIRGLKVHGKICLVVRRGRDGIRRYVHLGTGNYNDRTARQYTDMGLLTSSPEIGVDASAFFNALTGFSDPPKMKKLVMAPTHLRDRLLKLIDRETRRAESGQAAEIRAKMNALVDERVVQALYRASQAGVRVRLNVRGICVLRPGVKGLSENIDVVSIVGRFLEHARVFHFHNGGDDEVFLSSADWMPRNLDRRIELMFPIETPECRRRVLEAFDTLFKDNVKGRKLLADGTWKVPPRPAGDAPFVAQQVLYDLARRAWDRRQAAVPETFEPISSRTAPPS